jgi:CD2 antigen cytoplasmic tail-binding protein 2
VPLFTFVPVITPTMISSKKRKEDTETNGNKKRVRIGETTTYEIPSVSNGKQDKQPDGVFETEDLESVKPRKGAFKADGYDSDEEVNDDNDSDLDSDAEPPKKADADDDDMFTDEAPVAAKPGFLKKEQIEGQEWGTTPEVEDGVKLMPFNMDADLDEGDFDQNGMFVKSKTDEFQVHDSWLQDVSKDGLNKTMTAQKLQKARDNAKSALAVEEDVDVLWRQAMVYMKPGETILNSLARLGGKKKIPKYKQKKLAKKGAVDEDDV